MLVKSKKTALVAGKERTPIFNFRRGFLGFSYKAIPFR